MMGLHALHFKLSLVIHTQYKHELVYAYVAFMKSLEFQLDILNGIGEVEYQWERCLPFSTYAPRGR